MIAFAFQPYAYLVINSLNAQYIRIYGYNAIVNFKNRAEQISCLKFKSDLSSAVEGILSDFGSVKRKDLELCNGYAQACFVETFESFARQNPQGTNNKFIIDSVKSDTGNNVFLIGNGAPDSFYAGKVSVNPDVLCIKAADNKISIRLEGKGNHVLLSQWG